MNRSILTATLFTLLTMTACAGTSANGPRIGGGGGHPGPTFGAETVTVEPLERLAVRSPELKALPQLDRIGNRPGPCPMPR